MVDLRALDLAVAHILEQESFAASVSKLEDELAQSASTFVWTTVDMESLPVDLPGEIGSVWIFHLRQDVPSGAHYHPNSVQHMAVVTGGGRALVGGEHRIMAPFQSGASLEDRWLVIPQGVAHEFTPEGTNMTVVSFHTCGAEELEEVECATGGMRYYEGPEAD